jgi:hypothetical protein
MANEIDAPDLPYDDESSVELDLEDTSTIGIDEEIQELEAGGEYVETLQTQQDSYNATTQKDLQDLYNDVFLSVYDIESALQKSSESFTNVLVERGIEVNPQTMLKKVDLINTRILTANIVKRLCMGLGLHGEYDTILNRELDLIYRDPKVNKPPTPTLTPRVTAQGEPDEQ